MATTLSIALILGAGFWFWLDSLRAREIATGICAAACNQHGVQFLDQTVALRRLGLGRTPTGLRLRRTYRFEYSEEGLGRRCGLVVMLATQLHYFSMEDRCEEYRDGKPSSPPG